MVHPKRASVSKEELKATLAKKYNVQDDKCIILFGFRVAFGKSILRNVMKQVVADRLVSL